MREWLLHILPVLHLSRLSSAMAAVGNVWFVILWTRGHSTHEPAADWLAGLPLWLALMGGGLMGLGLYVFAASLNDVLDARRDRALRRGRPITDGHLGLPVALMISISALLMGIAGATVFGGPAVPATLIAAAAILLYNTVGKFVPGFGLVLVAFIYAAHMLAPNVRLQFVWPVWLVMTHTAAVAAAGYALSGKTPPISTRAWTFAIIGWLALSILLLRVGLPRAILRDFGPRPLWPDWIPVGVAITPMLMAVLFVMLARHRLRRLRDVEQTTRENQRSASPTPSLTATATPTATPSPTPSTPPRPSSADNTPRPSRAGEKLARYGSLWLPMYATAWLAGTGLAYEALLMAALAGAALLGTIILRDLNAMLDHPMGYRRV